MIHALTSFPILAAAEEGGLMFLLFGLTILVVIVAGFWQMFTKAGEPGIMAIIPIVNIYFLLKIAGRPGWWLLLFLVPIVNFVVSILVFIDVAKSFGKGEGFGIGMALFPFIFVPILGFSDAEYQGPAAA